MTILSQFMEYASRSPCTIAFGLGDDPDQARHIFKVAQKFLQNIPTRIIFIGHPETINRFHGLIKSLNLPIELASSSNPSQLLVQSLFDNQPIKCLGDQEFVIDAIIRGGLASSTFLKVLRGTNEQITKTYPEFPALPYRLALLETSTGHQFFFAPVGIDEANKTSDKKKLLDHAIQFMNVIGITPEIALLSGGRLNDIGRDPWIDQNIEEAENLTRSIQKDFPQISIKHYQILIENAIADKCNLILAPEGIAGNLIYRTLVHLGHGKSYGALYLPYFNICQKTVIDTSRVAPEFEIEGALFFAAGMKSKYKK